MNEHQPNVLITRSLAEIVTPQAERYLVQLCKHFQHKRPVTFDGRSGHIAFSGSGCRLEADEEVLPLVIVATDDPQLTQLQGVGARHLLRFPRGDEHRVALRLRGPVRRIRRIECSHPFRG